MALDKNVVADSLQILYGGSVKPGNARELFGMPDIDGGLIGGAHRWWLRISSRFVALQRSKRSYEFCFYNHFAGSCAGGAWDRRLGSGKVLN